MIESKIAYTDSGKGPAILFLHGYPFDRSMWREQVEFLSGQGFRAIAPDLGRFGKKSDKLEFVAGGDRRQAEAYRTTTTMDEMARDAAALLTELEIHEAVVCGLSMGGYVAFEFANLFPTRTRGLVLAGTRAPADNEKERQGRLAQIEQMLAEGMAPIADATLPKLLAPTTLAEKPEVVARVKDMILKTDPGRAAAAQRGMAARRDYSDDLARINVPALIIVGREDPIRPVADSEFMHKNIRDSRLEVIDDAAHMTNLEQPEKFNHVLLHFLQA